MWTLCLYGSDSTPTVFDTFASFLESAFAGYARQPGTPWSVPFIAVGGDAGMTGPLSYFVNEELTDVLVYGGLLVDFSGPGPVLWAAERFAGAPLTIPSGYSLARTPTLYDRAV